MKCAEENRRVVDTDIADDNGLRHAMADCDGGGAACAPHSVHAFLRNDMHPGGTKTDGDTRGAGAGIEQQFAFTPLISAGTSKVFLQALIS